ncbi:MAG: hypothetical protein ACK5PG_11585 [Lysobacterales bacterium]|jgi:hypothetical protein
MDKQFVRHVIATMASRFGLELVEGALSGGKAFSAALPETGVRLGFTPLPGQDELDLSLAWPAAHSTSGYADLRRFQAPKRRETGFWIDVRWLLSVDRRFPSDPRFDGLAFRPRPVDFSDIAAALTGSTLPLEKLAKRLDYSEEKTQRLLRGHYLSHPEEITPALRRSLPDWSTLGRVVTLPMPLVKQASAHWEALLDCVLSEGVAEFIGLLHALPCECLPAQPPRLQDETKRLP